MAVSKRNIGSPPGEQFAEHMYTKEEFLHRFSLLQEFVSRHLFTQEHAHTNGGLAIQIKKFFASREGAHESAKEEEAWMNSLGEDFFARFSAQNANNLFSEIEAYVKNAAVVTLSLARAIPEEQQKEIGRWIKKNVGPAALYDMRIAPELIAGCSISFKGLFQDFSLQNTLAQERKNIIAQLQAAVKAK